MTAVLVDLDDRACLDSQRTGAKAARLALARSVGLPVLPGVVVPVDQARPVLCSGIRALADGGSGKARLAVMAHELNRFLIAELVNHVGAWPGTPTIVRSSSNLEDGGCWAGAFSTFEDVSLGELPKAVLGVWASVFTVDALARFELTGADLAETGMAVLIQPYVRPQWGGVAVVRGAGTVDVVATNRRLRGLTTGWDHGVHAIVTPDGGVRFATPSREGLDSEPFVAAAALARSVGTLLGDDTVEWAWMDGDAVLLQCAQGRPGTAERVGQAHATGMAEVSGGDRRSALPDEVLVQHLALGASGLPGRDLSEAQIFTAVQAATARAFGAPAAPGIGAGRVIVIRDPHTPPPVNGRDVVVAPLPLPALAPLLWNAAGLVTTGGNATAHLVHVARALGVPAVIGARLEPAGLSIERLEQTATVVAAVDGSTGSAAFWWPGQPARVPAAGRNIDAI